MATNLKLVATLSIVALVTIQSTCKKRLDCFNQMYSFTIGSKVFPDKDSIHVGDTIWLDVNTPCRFIDMSANKEVEYSGAENLGLGIQLAKFTGGTISNPGGEDAANSFDYKVTYGQLLTNPNTNLVREFKFLEENGLYKLRVGVVPKQIGIFSLAISNAANVYRKGDKCTKASFKITYANTDQHLYLYQANRPGYEISEYERTHMYCFKVN